MTATVIISSIRVKPRVRAATCVCRKRVRAGDMDRRSDWIETGIFPPRVAGIFQLADKLIRVPYPRANAMPDGEYEMFLNQCQFTDLGIWRRR